MYKLRYKIWLETSGKAFGQGPYNLLTGIQRHGSLSQAAKEMHMSYSQAHTLMKKLSQNLGFPLLISHTGGSGGGETSLTPEAVQLMKTYDDFYQECSSAIEQIFIKYFSETVQGDGQA